MRRRIALMTKTLSEMKNPRPFIVTECTDTDYRYVRVRVNLTVGRVGRDRVRVSNQDVVETGYTPSS